MTANYASSTVEPLLDLRGLVAGIFWRRRLWCSAAVIGGLLGITLTLLVPPTPTAVTRVLVARTGEVAVPETLMATDVALFNTNATAAAALQRLGLHEDPQDFRKTFNGTPVTGSVLEIIAEGPSDAAAVRRAQVLAERFITDHVERARAEARAQAQALLEQRGQLQRQLTDATDDPPVMLGEELDAATQSRIALESEIAELERRARDALIAATPVAAGTQIVDPPRATPNSFLLAGLMNVGVGAVLGLALGLALAAVLCVTRDRPVLRRDIAAHLGVSVIVQLPAAGRGRVRNGGRAARERRCAADTLARVIRAEHGTHSLLEVGCPRTTAALAAAIARELAAERPVTLVDRLGGGHLDDIRSGKDGAQVEVVDPAGTGRTSPAAHGDYRLGVGSVGPGTSWVDLDRLGSRTLLVVRAGHATTLWLHTVARQLSHAGISPIGVVLVAPYPWDGTDGTLWEGLHSVLRAQRTAGEDPVALDEEPTPRHNPSGSAAHTPIAEMRQP